MKSAEGIFTALILLAAIDMIFSSYSNPFKIGISQPVMPNISMEENISTTLLPTTITTVTVSTIQITKTSSSTLTPPTTLSATSTTVAPTANKTNDTSLPSFATLQRQFSSTYYCGCDFKLNFCDVNCCCDVDCTNEMLKAFDCDEKHQTLYDFQYQQGLPSCKLNDGWLCVFKDNSEREPPEVYNTNPKVERKYGWPKSFLFEDSQDKERESYKTGDPIMVYDEQTEEVSTFDLPYSVLNARCNVLAPIQHLTDFTRSCLTNSELSQDYFKALLEQYFSLKLLKSRKGSLRAEHMLDQLHYVDIHLHHCLETSSPKNCQNVTNSTLEEFGPSTSKLEIVIEHNFTTLLGCDVFFISFEQEETPDATIWQHIQVKFLQPNETKSPHRKISGKLGYTAGHPVIKGKYVPINDTVDEKEKQFVIDYFHHNATTNDDMHSILLPTSMAGLCARDSSEQINFNENTRTQCFVRPYNSSLTLQPDSNYTAICVDLQKTVFNYLINDQNFTNIVEFYISELGSPRNNSSNWIKVETKNFEPIAVLGSFDGASNSFSCRNMILNIRYEFITARISVNGIRHQNLIKSASIEFGKRVDLQLKLEEDSKIPLYIDVMFYDVTNVKSASSLVYVMDLKLIVVIYVILLNII